MIQLRECTTAAEVNGLYAFVSKRIRDQRREQRRLSAQRSKEDLKQELIQIVLRGPAPLTDPIKPWQGKIRDVQIKVSRFYGIALGDLVGQRRYAKFCLPRQIAMYLCSHVLHRTLPEIGRQFGGRDHTTALHAVRMITVRCDRDLELRDQVAELERIIRG